MGLKVASDTLENFERLTSFNLTSYLGNWADFVDSHYQNFVDYFKGSTNFLNQTSTNKFFELIKQRDDLDALLINYSESFDRMDYWNLLDYLDDVNGKISYMSSISKFLRTSKFEGFNEDSLSIEYTTADYDTPETIASKDSTNPQDDWVDIYVKNNVLEKDYKAGEGGQALRLGKRGLKNLFLNTVVDNLFGDNLYGKDIYFEFIFENDDIKVALPRDTFKQSAKILIELGKGDIPEYPRIGVSKDFQIGNNIGLVNLPFIVREYKDVFSTDDTMVNFFIEDIDVKGTSTFFKWEVESFYNLTYKNSKAI